MRYAAKGHAAHGQGSATRRAAGPVTQPSPAGTQPVVADKRLPGAVTAPAGGAPATTPSAAPAAAATAPQATPVGSGPPPAAQPAETTTTDTQGSGGTGEPPAGEPAATPAPAAHGQISAWTPDPGGAEGLLAVRSGDNAPVARRVSRSTDLRCYRVSGDALVAFGSCPASALVTGRPVASAELQPADGGLTWRLVYLIVPA
jgi:hypothetical protein